MTAGELDTEAVVVRASHPVHSAGEDLSAVAAHLLTTNTGQLRWRLPFVAEVAVHVGSGGVTRLARVDDDDGPALAAELECGGEPGCRSSDDGNVAVSLHGGKGVVTHDRDVTV